MQNRLRTLMLLGSVFALSVGTLVGCGDKNGNADTENRQETVADDAEESTEKSELSAVEQPQFIANSLRKLTLVQDGEEIFQIAREPAAYKMNFDYWEILNPYDEIATVNTETMYELFNMVATLDLTTPVAAEEGVDTGIPDTKTSMTIEFVNTLDDNTAKEKEEADSTATILIGSEDGEGYRYAAVKGYEDKIYRLPTSVLYSIYSLDPFDYILKIPALVNLDTVERVDITASDRGYTMEKEGENYKLGKKKVEKEKFTTLYQALMNITLNSEIQEPESNGEKEEVLRVAFHRNTEEAPEVELVYYTYDDTYDSVAVNGKEQFLVKAEEVNALLDQIEEAY